MCGFAGYINFEEGNPVSIETLKRMTDAIVHRGPDDEGFHIDKNVGLGFRRLSIIDLHTGHQPMSDSKEKAWIIFNGEIYNYKQLRERLISLGYIFNTHSDTEVILNCYFEYGEKLVDYLRGMFSFVIWDKQKQKCTIARDRFGIKPLFYSITPERLIFASEMKSIIKGGFSNKELDVKAVDSFFSYGYILDDLSIYKDIRKLPSAHLMQIEKGVSGFTNKIVQYWNPTFISDTTIKYEDYILLLQEKLKETVQAHLVSDVSVGAFLSGGIDSNIVVSEMARISPEKVKTFTIGFNETGFNEAVLAKQSAEFYGTEHTELYLNPESASILDKITDMYDEPFADSSAIPTYFLSKLASEYVKVVLSGDGGDEFFGGYTSYQRLLKINKYASLIKFGQPFFSLAAGMMPATMKGRRFLYSLTKDPELLAAYSMEVYEQEKKSFYHPDFFKKAQIDPASSIKAEKIKNSKSNDFISKMMELDLTTFMVDDVLTKVDRASMANSLEVRVPLIDHEFFELAGRIPPSMKIKGSTGKYIFKEAFKNQIPEYIYNKPKTGFTIPITKWFKADFSDYVINALEEIKGTGIVNPTYVDSLLKTKDIGSLVTRIWPMMVFANWYKKNKV